MSQLPIDVFADCSFGEPRCVIKVGDHQFVARCFDMEQANNARRAVVTALESVQTDAIEFDKRRQLELAYQRREQSEVTVTHQSPEDYEQRNAELHRLARLAGKI